MCIKSDGLKMRLASEASPSLLDDRNQSVLSMFAAVAAAAANGNGVRSSGEQPLDLTCKRKRKLSEVSDRSTPSLKSGRFVNTGSSTEVGDQRPLSADHSWGMTPALEGSAANYNFLNLLSLYRNSIYSPPAPPAYPASSGLLVPVPSAVTPIIGGTKLTNSGATSVTPTAVVTPTSCGTPLALKEEPDENCSAFQPSRRRPEASNLRPFKAYTNGAISLSTIKPPSHPDFDQDITEKLLEQGSSEEAYSDYRARWHQMRSSGVHPPSALSPPLEVKLEPLYEAGSSSGSDSEMFYTNPRMKRHPNMTPEELKDQLYWERRRKNNEAAKRSREARRAKEEEMTIRANYLEQENMKLRVEIAALKTETSRIKCMLYSKAAL